MAKTTTPKRTAPPTIEGKKRTQNGVDKRPIALRLMPTERAQVEREADARGVTMAAFSRACFVQGLRAVCQRRPAAHPQRTRRSAKP